MVAPAARAMLVYTPGTTAEPKGVQHTHRTLLAEVASVELVGARQLAMFPPGHVAGLLGLLRVLVLGTPTVVLEQWDPRRAAQLVDEHRLTNTAGAPVQLAGLLDARERGEASLASLSDVLVGAAAVPPVLIRRADAAGIRAYRCYGSSEHPTVSSGRPEDPLEARATTDGRLLPDCEVRIAEDGEILSRGPELFIGYTDPTLDRDAFADGWYRTGDVGRLDGNVLTVTDRKKVIVIRGGENISSAEVEAVLGEHESVAEVAVIGEPDERLGERVCAVVVLRSGRSLSIEDVRRHFAAAGVARQKTPERLIQAGSLPRTPAGKVRKHLLRALLG